MTRFSRFLCLFGMVISVALSGYCLFLVSEDFFADKDSPDENIYTVPQKNQIKPPAYKRFLSSSDCIFKDTSEGELATAFITFQNISNKDILIDKIQTGCNCVRADLNSENRLVKPLKEIRIPITINTTGKEGLLINHCDVLFHEVETDTNMAEGFLCKIKVLTPGKMKSELSHIDFGKLAPGQNFDKKVVISFLNLYEEMKIPVINKLTFPEWLHAELGPASTISDSFSLRLSGTVPNSTGKLTGVISLMSDAKSHNSLDIPVTLTINGLFNVMPNKIVEVISENDLPFHQSVFLELHTPGKIDSGSFTITNQDGITISTSYIDSDKFSVTIAKSSDSHPDAKQKTYKGDIEFDIIFGDSIHHAILPVVIVIL
ncbi:MAG: DUF1573 domain-containing protein [Planctomycetia bacterium]|nr:DUF1573 domain-containing protein [Planctomycetia bacterium]